MEAPIIAGIAHDRSEGKITIVGVPDRVGIAAKIFGAIAEAGINIDMIVQNVSAAETAKTDISFTLPEGDGPKAMSVLQGIKHDVEFEDLRFDDSIGKIALVGAGMKSPPRRLGQVLQGARRGRHQHRDDLDVRDPGLGGDPRRGARRGGPRGPHRLRPRLDRGRHRLRRHRPLSR